MSLNKLPKFRHPPVVETVLGIQFHPLPGLTVAHLGAFWGSLGQEWPHVSQAPPTEPQFEVFDETKTWGPPPATLKLVRQIDVRVQIRNGDRDRMIQVQNGRLYYNWIGSEETDYPEYEKVRPGFDWAWGAFQEFVRERTLGNLRPNQWEITYINHIPKGVLWGSPTDWHRVIPRLAASSLGEPTTAFEGFSGEWHFRIEPKQGRLHVSVSHGLHEAKKQEVLILNLTARGPIDIDGKGGLDLDQGLRVGHEVIVGAFNELTSNEAHLHWEPVDD